LRSETVPRVKAFEQMELYSDIPEEDHKRLAAEGWTMALMPEHVAVTETRERKSPT
jgi:hypothetical protein